MDACMDFLLDDYITVAYQMKGRIFLCETSVPFQFALFLLLSSLSFTRFVDSTELDAAFFFPSTSSSSSNSMMEVVVKWG
jgi:hypothetical protein